MASERSIGASPNSTTTSAISPFFSRLASADFAARTASPVPRGGDCTAVLAGATARATASIPGPSTTTVSAGSSGRSASVTCRTIRHPAISCSTLGKGEVQAMVGDGIPALVTRGFAGRGADATEASEALPDFLAIYEASAANLSRPYPGVRDTLVELRRRGYRTAVCTNKVERATLAVLRGLDLMALFDGLAGGDRFAVRKPDPGPLLGLISELGARPERAALLGDK